MSAVQLLGSLVAILVLAGGAWALGLGKFEAPADDEAAIRIAQDALPGFAGTRAWRSTTGDAALVQGRDGSIALIRAHGAHPAVRQVRDPAVRLDGAAITIGSGDARFGDVTLRLPDAAQAAALAELLTKV